jgi:DNA-binding IclR family transcriptional regulator
MAHSSPGVRRIAAILNFMAAHPGQAFALTDLVRALQLSRATCHSLLLGLVSVGYLYRASDKSYVLGPALAALGRAAAQSVSPLQVAQPEMRRLADEFDVVCAAYFLEGDIVHVRERAASRSHIGYSAPAGTRVTLRTPFAAPYIAWSPAAAKAWLGEAGSTATPAQRKALKGSMEFARRHGFVVFQRRPGTTAGERSPEEVFAGENAEYPVTPLAAISGKANYRPASILAPVFDAAGNVAFVLGLAGFNRVMTGTELVDAAGKLRLACSRISAFMTSGA